MRREAKHSFVSQSHIEEERDIALTDFRILMAEKESLGEKLKVSFIVSLLTLRCHIGKGYTIMLCLCLAAYQFPFSITLDFKLT